MSDIRINALATTATSAASDDYLALDGSANGTRKILATNVAQNVTDVTFGASGPSAKSSINARAARQGLVFDGTAGATATLGSAIGESAGTINIVFTVPSAIPSAAMEVFDLYGTGGGDLNDLYITILGTSGDLRLNARYSGTNHLVTLYSGFVTAYAGKTVELAVVLDGTNQTTYLNGVQISQTAIDHNLTGAVNAFLGKSPAGTDIFKGTISSPLIYNRALSAAEVVSLFEAGVPSAADYNTASNTSLVSDTQVQNNTGSFWSVGGGTSFTGTAMSVPAGGYAYRVFLTAGNKYRCTVNIASLSAGLVTFDDGVVTQYAQYNSTGTRTFEFTAASNRNFSISSSSGTALIQTLYIYPLGLLLAPDAGQAGGGLTWYDTSGNAANITLPASGVAWSVPSSQKTASGWTFGGNLTVSGTGTSSFQSTTPPTVQIANTTSGLDADANTANGVLLGTLKFGHPSDGQAAKFPSIVGRFSLTNASFARNTALDFYTSGASGPVLAATINESQNFLVGTAVDSSNGKLQLATHTTSAGGIGFGTDTSLYRLGAGWLALDSLSGDNPVLWFRESGSSKATIQSYQGDLYVSTVTSGKSMYLRTGINTTALTLASDQSATFAGTAIFGKGGGNTTFSANGTTAESGIFVQANTGFVFFADNATAGKGIKVDVNNGGLTVLSGGITTASAGGSAGTWKLGVANTVSPTSPNRTITIDIGGTTYYLAAKTTND